MNGMIPDSYETAINLALGDLRTELGGDRTRTAVLLVKMAGRFVGEALAEQMVRRALLELRGETVPTAVPDAPVLPASADPYMVPIVVDTSVRYVDGNKGDKGNEILVDNAGGFNVRIHCNAGRLREHGVPASDAWYPLARDVVPEDAFDWSRGPNGTLLVHGKDFTSKHTGQKYRFEGFHFGENEQAPFWRYSTYRFPSNECRGALIYNWASVA